MLVLRPVMSRKSALEKAKKAGHINVAGSSKVEVLSLTASSRQESESNRLKIRSFEIQKRARSTHVPTSISEVKSMLRGYREPVTLFGETDFDRRERLKVTIATLEIDKESDAAMKVEGGGSHEDRGRQVAFKLNEVMIKQEEQEQEKQKQKNVFYSPATPEMTAARELLTNLSFARAKSRLSTERDQVHTVHNTSLVEKASSMTLSSTAVSEQRPLMKVRFSCDGQYLATGSFAASIKLWNSVTLENVAILSGHSERINALAWHPLTSNGNIVEEQVPEKKKAKTKGGKRKRGESMSIDEPSPSVSALLASTSADGKCLLWDCSSISTAAIAAASSSSSAKPVIKPVNTLVGHKGSVTYVDFHPVGKHLATAGVDFSWRLWDIETAQEILLQDGHSHDCTNVVFQNDGSLLLSTDAGGYTFLWDIRSGKRIHIFEKHADKITSAAFHPNGYQAATAGLDNMVNISDLRKKGCAYHLPAHCEPITSVFYNATGDMLGTSSFDGTVKLWETRSFKLLNQLSGHTGKVMGAHFKPDSMAVASVGFDRTLKLYE